MANESVDWTVWRRFFEGRADRPMPGLALGGAPGALPESLARSLAIFQLGESGGGTVIEQSRTSALPGTDGDYAEAMALFVEEEHRHADLLACCVWALGGSLIRRNWTAHLFVAARRLMGLRLKVMVLLAAEVVGICYYYLLASRLPPCQIRTLLAELVLDERDHLRFHCCFLRTQASSLWRRVLFVVAWRTTMIAASVAVLVDHRRALRDLNIGISTIWQRWNTYSRMAERLVVGRDPLPVTGTSGNPGSASPATGPAPAIDPTAKPETRRRVKRRVAGTHRSNRQWQSSRG